MSEIKNVHDNKPKTPKVGFGGAALGNLNERISEAQADATIEEAYAAGIRYFDTSPLYGLGLSELRLGHLLRALPRDEFMLSTKVGRYMVPPRGEVIDNGIWTAPLPMKPVFDYSYDGTLRSLEQSILRLGVEFIDIVFIHDIDRQAHGASFDRCFDIAMNGAYRALCELRKAGYIGAIGVGINEADVATQFVQAAEFDYLMLAGRYTLLDQSALESFLPAALEKHVGVIAAGVFNSGILAQATPATFDYVEAPAAIVKRVRSIAEICSRHGVPLQAAAAQFPFGHPAIKTVVLGMMKAQQVRQNLDWIETPIPSELWDELKHEKLLPRDVPVPLATNVGSSNR